MSHASASPSDASRREGRAPAGSLLSVVVPVFNEGEVLPAFHARLSAVLDALPLAAEVVYVDDRSRDSTSRVLQGRHARDGRVAVVEFTRNFGKEIAMTAGLDHARGDAVVVIDADLQDPPELIPELVRVWGKGTTSSTGGARAGAARAG